MYDPARVDVAKVVAPPYDVISDADRAGYYAQDPHNVVRLISGEVRSTDTAEDNKYLRAARFYSEWLEQGVLRQEAEPALYLYRHEFVDPASGEAMARHGILGVVELEAFGAGVLPHERTHARAKADRLSLTRAVRANLSPIFSLYEDPQHLVKAIKHSVVGESPRLSVDGREGEHHTVWAITDPVVIRELVAALAPSRLYIADGHHRYETALNFRNKMRAEHPEAPSEAAFNFVLMLLVDVADAGLIILPTHRMVHDVDGFDSRRVLKAIDANYPITKVADREALSRVMQEPASTHRIGLVFPQQSPSPLRGGAGRGLDLYDLDIPLSEASDPVSSLDVTVLHRDILQRAVDLPEAALEDERYISYSRDLDAVLERVASGVVQAAFILRPPAVADVVSVADAGQVMPQKSTYFYPKPASGIVFNPLDPTIRIPAV